MPGELTGELRKLAEEFGQMKIDAAVFLSGVTDKEFNKKPDTKKWSIAECIDHLIIVGYDYSGMFEDGLKLAEEKNLRSSGNFKNSWFAQRFINSVEPPVRIKARVPRKWMPAAKINKAKATTAIMQLQDRWIELIIRSVGLDISRIKLPSPPTKLIKFSAFETLGVQSAHQRRHLEQAKKVKNKL